MKIDAIINSASRTASHRTVRLALERKLDSHELRVHCTGYQGHAIELARKAVDDGADIVVAVGGDGTVNEVLNGIIGSDTRLAVLPTGTANDLASHFGIPRNIDRACDAILTGHSNAVDVVRVNDWHYLTTGGLGLPCEALGIANRFKYRKPAGTWLTTVLRSRVYLFGLMLALATRVQKRHQLVIRFGQQRIEINALSLTISNLPVLGRRFRVAPQARTDDGLFDLCVIEGRGIAKVLPASISAALGKHGSRSDVKSFQVSRATVESNRPVRFFGDGELRPAASKFKIDVLPRAIRLITPAASEGC